MAFIDLGYKPRPAEPKPRNRIGAKPRAHMTIKERLVAIRVLGSTSPTEPLFADGVFGQVTESRLRHFQNDNYLPNTGDIDRKTLLELDSMLLNYKYRIRVHFRSFPGTKPLVQWDMPTTQGVFGEYGIKVEYASGKSFRDDSKFKELFSADTLKCKLLESGKITKLNSRIREVPSDEITILYVKKIEQNYLGCAYWKGHGSRTVPLWSNAQEITIPWRMK